MSTLLRPVQAEAVMKARPVRHFAAPMDLSWDPALVVDAVQLMRERMSW